MCDIESNGRLGWHGWRHWPDRPIPRATGAWHDLSHRLHNELPVPHVFPKPSYGRITSMPKDRLNITQIEMVCHIGTHVDAPLHLFMDGPAFDQIPLGKLHGQGVVWALDVGRFDEISVDMLAAMRPLAQPGDMVLLHTGWASRFGTDQYLDNPALTVEAAEWLLAQDIKLLGVDFATPDLALPRRAPDFDWPVHKVLLGNGVLIAENLADFGVLAGQRVEIICGALNIEGADGSPARILARTIGASA